MSTVRQRYRDISPVTLQVVGGAVSAGLYCEEVEGLSGGLVESFLVELYRCKLCQFTCGLRASISSHLLLRHPAPSLPYLGGADEGVGTEDREGAGPQQGSSTYQLDLNGESKQSDEDEEFLLYNMLDNMSPPTCDISSEGGLQVAHTCEVSTLFEEESSIFPLKGGAVDLSCPINPPATQEEMAQSAHLMTLGLCRISAAKPPPPHPPGASRPLPPPPDEPPRLWPPDRLKPSETDGRRTGTPTSGKRRLPCLLCPSTLPSRRLLDVHVRSHGAAGGFSCVRCSWTADSWEELEPHWRSHCRRRSRRRRGRREEQQQEKKKKKKKKRKKEKVAALRRFSCAVCLRTFRSDTSLKVHQQTHDGGVQRPDGVGQNTFTCPFSQQSLICNNTDGNSADDLLPDGWRSHMIGRAGGKEADGTDSETGRLQAGSLSVADRKQKSRAKTKEEEKRSEVAGFCCSLCHRKFSTKLTLRRHLGVHGGEKPFTCPHCPYSSRLKASLLQHLRTHTGEKPYRCSECHYASIDRSSLLRHSRTHSQEKPYRCQHCDYSSIQKKSLDLHARRHHTGEAFPCQQCEYSSPDRQLLLRHIRRNHAPSQHAAV